MSTSQSESQFSYEDRVVAFLDILGFKNLISNGSVSIILKAMGIVARRLALIEDVSNSAIRKSQFSDSIILSSQKSDDGIIHLVHFTSLLVSELFLNGIWCRGALATGSMLHDGDVAFGPALVDAIELECSLAIYPRVLVTDNVADAFVSAKNRRLARHRQLSTDAYFRRDFDHVLHLDIFSPTMFIPPQTGTITDAIGPVHKYVMDGINCTQTPSIMKIQAKLFWIASYLSYVDQFHGKTHFNIQELRA